MITLNERAHSLTKFMAANAQSLHIEAHAIAGATVLDCGAMAPGGLQAGLFMARACMAKLAEVTLAPGEVNGIATPLIQVQTDEPVLACMASQYAGWQISVGDFFAMGSGPMRAAYGKEELFQDIPGKEHAPVAVGVLETEQVPDKEVIRSLSEQLKLAPEKITLLIAPASSMAGNIQVVARSLETALHKLHELNFDLGQVVSGYGTAPLPPVAKSALSAIGRTNDAILYGGRVVIWVEADDDQLAEVGPKVPSSASSDHGEPFEEIFARYQHDFYKIDPMLFSPAELVLHNLRSGRSHSFGQIAPEVLQRSFFGTSA